MNQEEILCACSNKIRSILTRNTANFLFLEEIRIRIGQPLALKWKGQKCYLTEQGIHSENEKEAYIVTESDLKESLSYISQYSLYAYRDQLKQGFLVLKGGHRVGVSGQAVMRDGIVIGQQNISSIHIRVAHEITGAADFFLPYLWQNHTLRNTLIISPPGLGKTTLLRDLIRQLSNGYGEEPPLNVGVVDERSELGALRNGIPQNQLGSNTDILDGYPKAEGIILLIRSMSPEVLALDEIGDIRDRDALLYGSSSGCVLLATIHGSTLEEVARKPVFREIPFHTLFQRFILLRKNGNRVIQQIWNENGKLIREGER